MLRPEATTLTYLCTGVVDIRKSIDDLALLVKASMELHPVRHIGSV